MPVTPPQHIDQCHRRQDILEGGYPTDFVERPSSELQLSCSICLFILKDPYHPVTCKCGTYFCKTCIEPIYENTKCCPICKEYFDGIAPNVALKRLINGKRVYCSYKENGCGWIGEVKDLNAHLKDETVAEKCRFFSVACTLCDAPIQRKLMFDHRNLHCLKRLFCCEFCEYTSDYTDITQNHILQCDCAVIKCSNAGCDEHMQRRSLSKHMYACPETVVRCELASLGCDDYFRRKEMDDHYKCKMPFHMSLIVTHGSKERQEVMANLVYVESENKKLNEKLKKTSDAVDVLRKEKDSLLLDSSRIRKDVKSLGEAVRILKQKLSEEEQKSLLLSGRLDEFKKLHNQQKIACEILNYQVNQNTDDMKYLASNTASDAKEMRESMKVLGEETGLVRDKVVADRRSIRSLEDKLEELQDLSSITLASRTGSRPVTIVLREFSKWQFLNTEWSSPSFYLNGYKLCLSAFVNGDPARNVNGYLSLYVHLMKGENDTKLSWPFQQTVTLELLHPDPSQTSKKENLPFDNNTDVRYTRRVMGQQQAIGWGYAKFIQHAELDKFLRGARDFLMIRVS